MKYLRQLALLFAFCIGGDFLSVLLGGAIPGNVIGMMLLFFCLAVGLLHEKHIGEVSDFFLNNMAFFFLPSCLGILSVYGQIHTYLLKILAVILLSTLLTAAVSAGTVHLVLHIKLLRLQARRARLSALRCLPTTLGEEESA